MTDYFARFAHSYDSFVGDFKLNKIFDYLTLDKKEILVDVGGGTGRAATYLKEHVRGCIVLDYSYEMLQKAKSKDDDIMLVQASSDAMPFRDGTVNQLFMYDTLHHIQTQEESIQDCERILSDTGKLMIVDFDRKNFQNKFLIFFEILARFNSKFLTPDELVYMCAKANLNSSYERPSKKLYALTASK